MHDLPSADPRARLLAAVQRHPAPTRHVVRWRSAAWWSGGALVSLVLFFATGGAELGGRSLALAWATAFGAFAAGLVAVQTLLARGASMLGPPARTLMLRSLALIPLPAVWKLAWTSAHAGTGFVPESLALGCVALSVGLGVGPLVAALMVRRGSDPLHPATTGFALGVVAGLTSSGLVDLACARGDAPHVIVAHVVPVLVLALLGALAGPVMVGQRPRPRGRSSSASAGPQRGAPYGTANR